MIKFFYNVIPKNNELTSIEISTFFLKNLHILIIITSIISGFFYYLIRNNSQIERSYNMVAYGYLVPASHNFEAQLELMNSEISEILKLGKISTDPRSVLVLFNFQELMNFSTDLLSSSDQTKRLINSELRDYFSVGSHLGKMNTLGQAHSVFFEFTFHNFDKLIKNKNLNTEDVINISRDFVNDHIDIVINEMRQGYLNALQVIEKLLIEEGIRLEYMIKEMEYLIFNNKQLSKNNDNSEFNTTENTYNEYLLDYNLSQIQIPFLLTKVKEIENLIKKNITRDLFILYDNEIFVKKTTVKIDKNQVNLFYRSSSIQITIFFSFFVFMITFLFLIFINYLIIQNKK